MDLTKISKFISLVLRHKPEAAGITLDEHGWADTYELIVGVKKKYPGFCWIILEQIVAMDEKQRYSFNEDKTMIRANQGHSIPVRLGLEPVEPPEYLYHGTAEKSVEGIEADGIRSMSRQYVHLSKDIETAKSVGSRHGKPVVFAIDSGLMHKCGHKFYLSENGIWLTKYVPARFCWKIDLRYW